MDKGYCIPDRFNEYAQIMSVIYHFMENGSPEVGLYLDPETAHQLYNQLKGNKGVNITQEQVDKIISLLLHYIPDEIKE